MQTVGTRGRLLAGAALGLGLAVLPQQAQAACTVTATTVVCGTTTTTNTTNAGATPAVDRNYPVDTSASAFTGTVSTGAIVDGFGLAFTNTVGGTNALNVVNNGTVQINAGNTATAGGGSVLQVTSVGATPVNYSGEGNIINLSTTSGHGLDFFMQGSGDLLANVGTAGGATTTISSGVPNAAAIQVNRSLGTAGNVTITTTSDTTLRATFSGINIDASGAGTMTVNNSATIGSMVGAPNTLQFGIRVVEGASGTGAIAITNNGAIGTAADRTLTAGIQASIANPASMAGLAVSGSGAVFSAGDGIEVANSATGATTVNYTGAINTTGATGVDVDATTGATSVTLGAVTAATNAVDVTSTGTQAITLNGATTGTAGSGIVSDTTGARTITIGAAGNVTGGAQAILLNNSGAATIANAGIIGAASTGLAINDAGGGATTITNTGTINGRVVLGAGNDTLTNTGTINTVGTLDFGLGTDSFANNGAGILNITGASTLLGLETFTNTGRINLNTFTLTGTGIAFTNAGTIDTAGSATLAGFTTLNNTGTLDLAAGTLTVPAAVFTNSGIIIADEGATTITGQTSFANSGTIDLQDGIVGDVLTINSDFAGTGGSNLLIDFTTEDADLLVINGAASGTTTVNANLLTGGLINLDGVLVVDATTATDGAFVLGTVGGDTPLVDFSLVQDDGDVFLVAAPNAAAFNPLVVPGFATDLWYQSANEVFAETTKPAMTAGISLWGEGYISRDRYGDDDDSVTLDDVDFDVDNRLKTKRYGIQLGVDYGFGGFGRVGLTGGYGWAKANGNDDADLKAKGWNLGLYGQFGGLTGFHGEFLAKHDRYDAEFDDGAFDGTEFDIRSTGVDGSLGFRFGLGADGNFDVMAGVSHVRTKVDDIEAFGFTYDTDRLTSTRGRAGVRGTLGGSLAPYVAATAYHEFRGDGDIVLFDGGDNFDLDTNGKGTWARIEAGLSGNDGPGPILAAWGDFGDRKGLGLRAGWRIGGGVVEATPPPPPVMAPPPPPEAPPTQTCADGSVILATDVCPAPPPPPPPPAPEPERG